MSGFNRLWSFVNLFSVNFRENFTKPYVHKFFLNSHIFCFMNNINALH